MAIMMPSYMVEGKTINVQCEMFKSFDYKWCQFFHFNKEISCLATRLAVLLSNEGTSTIMDQSLGPQTITDLGITWSTSDHLLPICSLTWNCSYTIY